MRKRLPLFLLILTVVVICSFLSWLNESAHKETAFIKRQLDATNSEGILKKWEYDSSLIFDYSITSDAMGNVYSINNSKPTQLIALDPSSGKIIWSREAPNETFYDQLIIIDTTLFGASAERMNAYRSTDGQLIWSTLVGPGHVGYTPQLDRSILREYYGQNLFEFSPGTGKILKNSPLDNILWIVGENEIQQNASGTELTGIDRLTGDQIWQKSMKPFLLNPTPKDYNELYLIVKINDQNYCALDLKQGEYSWCLDGISNSNFAVDESQGTGYVLRDDFELLKIDLLTGKTIGKVQFIPGEQKGNNLYYHKNYIAVTRDHTIILNFGDSKQLIGLSWN
jgi:PQQ-like domain